MKACKQKDHLLVYQIHLVYSRPALYTLTGSGLGERGSCSVAEEQGRMSAASDDGSDDVCDPWGFCRMSIVSPTFPNGGLVQVRVSVCWVGTNPYERSNEMFCPLTIADQTKILCRIPTPRS